MVLSWLEEPASLVLKFHMSSGFFDRIQVGSLRLSGSRSRRRHPARRRNNEIRLRPPGGRRFLVMSNRMTKRSFTGSQEELINSSVISHTTYTHTHTASLTDAVIKFI